MLNSNIRKAAKVISIILTLVMLVSLVSCVDTSNVKDHLDDKSNVHKADETTSVETQLPTASEGYTEMPVVESVYRIDPQTVIIAGTCENDATVTIEGASDDVTTVKAVGTNFIAEVYLKSQNDVFISVYAKAGTEKKSEPNILSVKYDGTAEKRSDGKSMIVGKDSWLFFDSTVTDYVNPSLFYEASVSRFTKTVNSRIAVAKKNGDIEFIFVLVPSKLTMYPEYAPDAEKNKKYEKTTINTAYTQIARALKQSNATVIDGKELLDAAKDGAEYPLFYRTDSHWSEYAAFLAYTELMNYISGNKTVLSYDKDSKTDEPAGTTAAADTTETVAVETEQATETTETAQETDATKTVEEKQTTDTAAETSETAGTTGTEDDATETEAEVTATETETTATEPAISYKVGGKFPSAAPLSIDKFDVKTVSALAGDVVFYSGISRELLREEFVRFMLKDGGALNIGSETKEPKASGEEPVITPNISDIKKYVSDTDFMIYNETGAAGEAKGTNKAYGFRTGRPELPSALILKDESVAPIFDILAERFNNSYFGTNGTFDYQSYASFATAYAGSAGNGTVDYVIFFISENNIPTLVSSFT